MTYYIVSSMAFLVLGLLWAFWRFFWVLVKTLLYTVTCLDQNLLGCFPPDGPHTAFIATAKLEEAWRRITEEVPEEELEFMTPACCPACCPPFDGGDQAGAGGCCCCCCPPAEPVQTSNVSGSGGMWSGGVHMACENVQGGGAGSGLDPESGFIAPPMDQRMTSTQRGSGPSFMAYASNAPEQGPHGMETRVYTAFDVIRSAGGRDYWQDQQDDRIGPIRG
jgi:hypothetical protein